MFFKPPDEQAIPYKPSGGFSAQMLELVYKGALEASTERFGSSSLPLGIQE